MWLSEAEKSFYEDVREKKKTASGVHGKTGKNGYVGKMRFPSDIMSRKDKMKYKKASKVMTTNIFDEILTLDEFEKLEDFEKRNRMQYWRTKYTNKEITTGMGIWNSKYYSIIKELDLPKAPRVEGKRKPRKAVVNMAESESKEISDPVNSPISEIIINGMHIAFTGSFTSEHIQNQLLKFATLLDGESDDFYIELKLIQKQRT